MEYGALDIDLTEDEQLHLICVTFNIDNGLLEDIKERYSDHSERIVTLVLSEAVARALAPMLEAPDGNVDDVETDTDD